MRSANSWTIWTSSKKQSKKNEQLEDILKGDKKMDFIKSITIVGTEEATELLGGIVAILEEENYNERTKCLGKFLSTIGRLENEKGLDKSVGSFIAHMCIMAASIEGTYEDRRDASKEYIVGKVSSLFDRIIQGEDPELEKKIESMINNLIKNKTTLLFDEDGMDAICEEVSNDA